MKRLADKTPHCSMCDVLRFVQNMYCMPKSASVRQSLGEPDEHIHIHIHIHMDTNGLIELGLARIEIVDGIKAGGTEQ